MRVGIRDGLLRVGPDAGLPRLQPLLEWKSGVRGVEERALDDATRAELDLPRPADVLARIEREQRELEEAMGMRASPDPDRARWKWASLARWRPVSATVSLGLSARGIVHFDAGYTRHSETLWCHRLGANERAQWVMRPIDASSVERACWADRVLRALSGGVLGEDALGFARWLEVAAVHEAEEPAATMADVAAAVLAGQARVTVPRHGVAVRHALPAFVVESWSVDPRAGGGERTTVDVPAEDVWALAEARRSS